MAEEFEEHSTRALQNPEKHMSNPVNAFLAVKRFTSDWDQVVQTYIQNNSTEGKALLQWYFDILVIVWFNHLKCSGIRWLYLQLFKAIQV